MPVSPNPGPTAGPVRIVFIGGGRTVVRSDALTCDTGQSTTTPTTSTPRMPTGTGSGRSQALGRLTGDLGDQVEVLVDVQNDEPGQLGGRGDDEVRHRGRTVPSAIGEQGLHLHGSILDGRRLVLDRDQRQRRSVDGRAQGWSRSSGVPDLQSGDGGDANQAPVDTLGPRRGLESRAEASKG